MGGKTLGDGKSIAIVGIGNVLLKDEGVGIRVIEELARRSLPGNVELINFETQALNLLDVLSSYEKVILVDAVKWGGRPGEVYRIKADELLENADLKNIKDVFSMHNIGLAEVIKLGKELGLLPKELVLVGIEAKEVDFSLELSKEVSQAVPEAVNLVLNEVYQNG